MITSSLVRLRHSSGGHLSSVKPPQDAVQITFLSVAGWDRSVSNTRDGRVFDVWNATCQSITNVQVSRYPSLGGASDWSLPIILHPGVA